MDLIRNGLLPEERDGFFVDEMRKRVWNKELQILQVIDELCEKHEIPYQAYSGTMLGAVRHGGFIPWDDDIDIAMLRPDYERFRKVAREELPAPYFFCDAYSDHLYHTISKVRDLSTTAIEPVPEDYDERMRVLHPAIFVDIVPLDTVSDGSPVAEGILQVQREMWVLLDKSPSQAAELKEKYNMVLDDAMLQVILSMSMEERFRLLEAHAIENYGKTDKVGILLTAIRKSNRYGWKKEWVEHVHRVPFENITIPVSDAAEEYLTAFYGNWKEPRQGASCHNGIIFDPDTPYEKYLEEHS